MSLPQSLDQVFPAAEELLRVEPEELGIIILQLYPTHHQNEIFNITTYSSRLFPTGGGAGKYDPRYDVPVKLAIAEAFGSLEAMGLIINDIRQMVPGAWWRLTRRGAAAIKGSGADIRTFARTHLLPRDILQPGLIDAVYPLFLRGEYDTAVFSAFRHVEVAVRAAVRGGSAGIPEHYVGVDLVRAAFNPKDGPLSDQNLVPAEREAEAHLFAGAIGHGKNPPSHRDIALTALQAARLIAFASHLLSIVDARTKR